MMIFSMSKNVSHLLLVLLVTLFGLLRGLINVNTTTKEMMRYNTIDIIAIVAWMICCPVQH